MRSVQLLVVMTAALVNSRVQAPARTYLMHGTTNIGPGIEA